MSAAGIPPPPSHCRLPVVGLCLSETLSVQIQTTNAPREVLGLREKVQLYDARCRMQMTTYVRM